MINLDIGKVEYVGDMGPYMMYKYSARGIDDELIRVVEHNEKYKITVGIGHHKMNMVIDKQSRMGRQITESKNKMKI